MHAFFEHEHEGDAYQREAITQVMACVSHCPDLFSSAQRREAEALEVADRGRTDLRFPPDITEGEG